MLQEGWDIEAEMKWGYFFFDKNRQKLEAMYTEIEERNYIFESIEKTDEGDYWKLFITKIEVHTPESLNNRNEAMNRLAKHYYKSKGSDSIDFRIRRK